MVVKFNAKRLVYKAICCLTLMSAVALAALLCATNAIALGDATTAPGEACPNGASPGFREYLPECRAYELVSPPFKDGSQLQVKSVSEDGTTLIAETLGAFAETGSDTAAHGADYLLSRSLSGWVVSALSPPASQFPAQALVAASPTLGKTLWEARKPTESVAAQNLYLREGDGSLIEIGPLLPPSVVAGPPAGENDHFLYEGIPIYLAASGNLSHVVFELHAAQGYNGGVDFWPGDTTEGEGSLYEYSGTGSVRPELVGVSSGHEVNEVEGTVEPVPAGQLISSCETTLGAYDDIYNAISQEGNTIFFTAIGHGEGGCHESTAAPPVNELYARVDGVETVPVSEPSGGQCRLCNTATRSEAIFAGASKNGARVFFTTSQELLPGATTTNLYEYNFEAPAGEHVTRVSSGSAASEVQGVARVSQDGERVYFVARGRLTSQPRGGAKHGVCYQELSPGEKAEEEVAEREEAEKAGEATHGGRCRPREGAENLYVYQQNAEFPAGHLAFVTTLCTGEDESGSLTGFDQCPSSSTDKSDWHSKDERPVQATPDGRFLVFESVGHLTETEDSSAQEQVYEYDAESEELVRVSVGGEADRVGGTESADAAGATIEIQSYAVEGDSPAQDASHLAVSGNGATVVFGSRGALTIEAQRASEANEGQGAESTYEYHSSVASGGAINDGGVHLISDGVNSAPSEPVGLDPNAQDIFFTSNDQLLSQDGDSQFDLYDARVDGGFGSNAAVSGGCEGGACGGPALTELSLPPAASRDTTNSAGTFVSPSPSKPSPPKPPLLTKSQKMKRALKACKKDKRKTKRTACERDVRAKYRTKAHSKTGKTGRTGR